MDQYYKSYEQAALDILRGKTQEDKVAEQAQPETQPKEQEPLSEDSHTENTLDEEHIDEAAVHPMALHVKRVPGQKKNGQEVYKVHAVGSKVTGIKAGEHLNDTELDDATEAGHKVKMMREEAEQVDEVSKKTLGSYVNKASVDMANRSSDATAKRTMATADYARNIQRGMSTKNANADLKKDTDEAKPDINKAVKRMYGIGKAVARLTKEEAEESYDSLVVENDSFEVSLPEQLIFADYLKAAKIFTESYEDAIVVADTFFRHNDETLVIESFTRGDIQDRINAHAKAGHQVSIPKYGMKDGKPYAEYTVTDKESGKKSKYIHHGSIRRVERS